LYGVGTSVTVGVPAARVQLPVLDIIVARTAVDAADAGQMSDIVGFSR